MKWITVLVSVLVIVSLGAWITQAAPRCPGNSCPIPMLRVVAPPVTVEVPATVAVTTRHREVTRERNVTRVDTEAYRPARVAVAVAVRPARVAVKVAAKPIRAVASVLERGHQRRLERRSGE